MSDWTQEPWTAEALGGTAAINGPNGKLASDLEEADAERIVECVNAMRGKANPVIWVAKAEQDALERLRDRNLRANHARLANAVHDLVEWIQKGSLAPLPAGTTRRQLVDECRAAATEADALGLIEEMQT